MKKNNSLGQDWEGVCIDFIVKVREALLSKLTS